MSERQTLTFLSKTLERAGLQPKTKYGQNFLVDLNLLKILIDGAELSPQDIVLEIGTGLGSLTKTMATKAGAIVTVEVDRDLQALATKELKPFPNVRLLSCEACRFAMQAQFHPFSSPSCASAAEVAGQGSAKR